ncbi:MAG TPA: cytidylate kinase-like family protein [Ardenticatenaceae bacterium]|nr:cytidylate kinase-like family protein [Ardenticatenaceae bacterium]
MSIITISRQTGSLGSLIGAGLARALAWRYVDREMIHRAASAAGVPDVALEELAYEGRRGFVDRLLSALRLDPAVAPVPDAGQSEGLSRPFGGILTPLLAPVAPTMQDYVSIVDEVVRVIADEGQVVIVGRAAQVLLAGRADAFHVQVIAPFDLRVARVRARHGEPRALVVNRLKASDETRCDYLERFYHTDWRDPLLYDMILNTGHVDVEAAIKLVALGWKEKTRR